MRPGIRRTAFNEKRAADKRSFLPPGREQANHVTLQTRTEEGSKVGTLAVNLYHPESTVG
jgi:hypothetical protein